MPAAMTWSPRLLARALAVAALVMASALPLAPARAADATVNIANNGGNNPYAYEPFTVTIQPGDSVTWVNPASTPLSQSQAHPTFCEGPSSKGECPWGSFPLEPGESHTVDFPAEGTFSYGCLIHPYMNGAMIVVGDGEPDAAPEPTPSEPSTAPTTQPSTSDEPTEEPPDATDDASTQPPDAATEDSTDEPTDSTSDISGGPRDALTGIGGTVSTQPSAPSDDATDVTTTTPTTPSGDGLTAKERAERDTPTGTRALRTLAAMGILAGAGMLWNRHRANR